MISLSKLPKEERDRLIQQYGSDSAQSKSSEQNLNQKINMNEVDEIAESSKVKRSKIILLKILGKWKSKSPKIL